MLNARSTPPGEPSRNSAKNHSRPWCAALLCCLVDGRICALTQQCQPPRPSRISRVLWALLGGQGKRSIRLCSWARIYSRSELSRSPLPVISRPLSLRVSLRASVSTSCLLGFRVLDPGRELRPLNGTTNQTGLNPKALNPRDISIGEGLLEVCQTRGASRVSQPQQSLKYSEHNLV